MKIMSGFQNLPFFTFSLQGERSMQFPYSPIVLHKAVLTCNYTGLS
jgi:hypothetical protein